MINRTHNQPYCKANFVANFEPTALVPRQRCGSCSRQSRWMVSNFVDNSVSVPMCLTSTAPNYTCVSNSMGNLTLLPKVMNTISSVLSISVVCTIYIPCVSRMKMCFVVRKEFSPRYVLQSINYVKGIWTL